MAGPAVLAGIKAPGRGHVPGRAGIFNTVAAITNTSGDIGCAIDMIAVRSQTSTGTMAIVTRDIGQAGVDVNRVRTGRKSGVFVTGVTGQSTVIPVSALSGIARVVTVHRAGAASGIIAVLVS